MKGLRSFKQLPLKTVTMIVLMGLVGCASTGLESAYQLIEQQQSQQALIRQHEADEWKKNTPNQREIALNAISETQVKGRYFASLAFIDAYIAEFGRDAEIDVMQAEAFRNTGQFEQSQRLYEKLVGSTKGAFAYRGLGLLAGQRHNYIQAADYLSAAVNLRPTDALLLSDLGFAQLKSGQLAQARVSLGKAAELDPENTKVLSNLALYLLVNNQIAQAEELMSRLKMTPAVQLSIYDLAHEIQQAQATTVSPKVVELAQSGRGEEGSEYSERQVSSVVRNLSEPKVAEQNPSPPLLRPQAASTTTYPSANTPFGFTNSRLIQ